MMSYLKLSKRGQSGASGWFCRLEQPTLGFDWSRDLMDHGTEPRAGLRAQCGGRFKILCLCPSPHMYTDACGHTLSLKLINKHKKKIT